LKSGQILYRDILLALDISPKDENPRFEPINPDWLAYYRIRLDELLEDGEKVDKVLNHAPFGEFDKINNLCEEK
jgi:hypothetical protein